jgi:N-acetylglucosaminyl-diphospho-decaprenol L-rhamnosyltransferase
MNTLKQDTVESIVKTTPPMLSSTVVVVTFNSVEWLKRCAAFYTQCPHLIFVDNASRDNTCQTIRTLFPHAVLIANTHNVGFGTACNQGMRAVQTHAVLLLNPDCLFDIANLKTLLHTLAEHDDAAIIAPQIISKKSTLEVSYRMGQFTWPARDNHAAQGLLCVEFVSGACMLMDKQKVLSVGGFDEQYFMYYEDEDLCLRLRLAGYTILLDPKSTVQHFSRTGSQQAGWAQFKSEMLRGKEHLKSKIRFHNQYKTSFNKSKTLLKLLCVALLGLPFVLLQSIWRGKYLARALGRLQGIYESSRQRK